MKTKYSILKLLFTFFLIALCSALLLPSIAIAQTEIASGAATTASATPTAPPLTATVGNWLSGFFKDNTNFWGQQTARISLNPLYSKGHAEDVTGGGKDTFGVALSLSFPIDDKGQVSVGLMAAYFDTSFFMGSVNTTFGKTVNIPVLNVPLFLWAEAGPAFNANQPDHLLAQAFTGGTIKIDIIKATEKSNPWTLGIGGGIGKVTGWEGDIYLGTIGLNHSFKGQ